MYPVFLSRLQFAAATMFHFLFVPLTLGLSILIAYQSWSYHLFKDPISEEDLDMDEAY